MLQIGPYHLDNPLVLAPMAGVTDRPFRQLCRQLGAGLVVSEMVTSDARLWNSRKSRQRLNHRGESGPIAVQIAGGEAQMMAQAARLNVERGAQIIDINMGCPAKKVCNKAAGSALLKDEALVADILQAVVAAVDVPVTLKIRTGWSPEHRNAVQIAHIAQEQGIAALAIHGRTRACRFGGNAEYDTMARVVQNSRIPVLCNGDIDSPEKARAVMQYTGAQAVMIGRAAQGRPWIFREINHYLTTGKHLPAPSLSEIRDILCTHLLELADFYGQVMGPRIARKHLGWYLKTLPQGADETFRAQFNQLEHVQDQHASVRHYFDTLIATEEKAA